MSTPFLTGVERHFSPDELIVSKTNTKGRITYANSVFKRVSGYGDAELLGKPHNLVRHPAMPRAVFKLLWGALGQGREVFSYVVNRCKNGDHYWVLAHVTPSFDGGGTIIGLHSSRRVPQRRAIGAIEPLYRELVELERVDSGKGAGLQASFGALTGHLVRMGKSYDEFILSL